MRFLQKLMNAIDSRQLSGDTICLFR
jgi:hypothetical protein